MLWKEVVGEDTQQILKFPVFALFSMLLPLTVFEIFVWTHINESGKSTTFWDFDAPKLIKLGKSFLGSYEQWACTYCIAIFECLAYFQKVKFSKQFAKGITYFFANIYQSQFASHQVLWRPLMYTTV